VFERRDRKDGRDSFKNFKGSTKYPDYYLQNFHYQTDGWLSAKSARLYDYQVESLFIGTADAMRRQVLPFFTKWVKDLQSQGQDPRVLDVATGTGRFASFMMDNCRSLDLDVLDLSPFYLAEAKKLLKQYDSVSYVEAAAETTGLPDASYDAITCVYLFHELPREVRKAVLAEWMRVLKPGGKVFFVDSAQEGEVPYDRVLEGFTIIAHEPYYLDYTRNDLSALFSEAGFQVDTTEVHWVSKLLCATKPGGEDTTTEVVEAVSVDESEG
jgi:ubiquinone/menaquinone biosynthesis C-methylase UbiE